MNEFKILSCPLSRAINKSYGSPLIKQDKPDNSCIFCNKLFEFVNDVITTYDILALIKNNLKNGIIKCLRFSVIDTQTIKCRYHKVEIIHNNKRDNVKSFIECIIKGHPERTKYISDESDNIIFDKFHLEHYDRDIYYYNDIPIVNALINISDKDINDLLMTDYIDIKIMLNDIEDEDPDIVIDSNIIEIIKYKDTSRSFRRHVDKFKNKTLIKRLKEQNIKYIFINKQSFFNNNIEYLLFDSDLNIHEFIELYKTYNLHEIYNYITSEKITRTQSKILKDLFYVLREDKTNIINNLNGTKFNYYLYLNGYISADEYLCKCIDLIHTNIVIDLEYNVLKIVSPYIKLHIIKNNDKYKEIYNYLTDNYNYNFIIQLLKGNQFDINLYNIIVSLETYLTNCCDLQIEYIKRDIQNINHNIENILSREIRIYLQPEKYILNSSTEDIDIIEFINIFPTYRVIDNHIFLDKYIFEIYDVKESILSYLLKI